MKLKDVRQLWGRDIDIVREGLDESQVADFVAELIGERDMLLQRQEHLTSLTMLAERTISEADRLSEDIRSKTEEEAKTKASAILAKAEKEAQELMEQKQAEILTAANKEAEAIRDSARQETERLVSQQQQRVQEEIKGMVQKLHNQLLSGLKEITDQATALQVEWESKLSGPITETLSPDDGKPSPSVAVVEEQSEEMAPPAAPEADVEYQVDVLKQLEQAWVGNNAVADSEEQAPATPPEAAHEPEIETADIATVELDEKAASTTYEGMVELDILSPLAPSQLVEIQRYLRDWPGVGITELRPSKDGYSITLALDKPMQLIEILRQLPEVEDAREWVADKAETPADTTSSKNGLKRIAITVCGKK